MKKTIILWNDIPKDTYHTSDRHHFDPDEHTKDRNGNTGYNLWRDATIGISSYNGPLIHHGDYVNYPSRKALLKMIKSPHSCLVKKVAGNHDTDLEGAKHLKYIRKMVFYSAYGRTIAAHGHQAQSIWSPGNKIGQAIVRIGDAMEQVVPWSDDAIMGLANKVSRFPFLIPRGWRDGREVYLKWGSKMLCDAEAGYSTLLHGHTHEPGVFIWDEAMNEWGTWSAGFKWVPVCHMPEMSGRLNSSSIIVDLGSWMPAHHDHPHGWYKKGDVAPMVWGECERVLYRVWEDGLEKVTL